MNVRVPVGSGHQYMQTAHMHNPTAIGEVCAEDFAKECPDDTFAIRQQALATEIKLTGRGLPRHERRYHEGYRNRLEQLADEWERESAPKCATCGECVLSNQPRYSCASSGDLWHSDCYSYEPGDDQEPVKFFDAYSADRD